MASKPKRNEVYMATTRPRRVSGAELCRMMLVPTLLTVMLKPSTVMASSDRGRLLLRAKTGMARPQAVAEPRIRRGRAAGER